MKLFMFRNTLLRFSIIIIGGFLFTACRPNGCEMAPPTRSLHPTETALLGSWIVEERRDSSWTWTSTGTSSDTTLSLATSTSYSGSNGLSFLAHLAFGPEVVHASALDMQDFLKARTNGSWYFDATQSKVITSAGTVISNNGSELVIRQEPLPDATSSWRRKISYYYLRKE